MTDQHENDRAEAAFRDALAAHAADEPFRPLVIETRHRPGWLRPGAAAAAILALAGFGLLGLRLLGVGGATGSVAAVPAQASAAAESRTNYSTDGAGPSAADGLPAPRDGWRFESFADILVQVPQSWGYGDAPGSDWCADGSRYPTGPYVDVVRGLGGVRAILCTGAIPADKLAMYLTFGFGNAPVLPLPKGWATQDRQFGDAYVRVVFPKGEAALAGQIMATAGQTGNDHNGCASTAPVQSDRYLEPDGPGLGAVSSVDAIAVCQYDVRRAGPGLVASTLLLGDDAVSTLAALKAAPLGGGPNTPESCLDTGPDGTALVLQLTKPGGVQDVFTYYTSCVNNGFFDGAQARALTAAACAPLVRDPVTIHFGSSETVSLCRRESSPPPPK